MITWESVSLDSLTTANFSATALGAYYDSRFGKTKAGFAAFFEPQTYTNATYFEGIPIDSIVFDSLMFIVQFSGTFGKGTDTMNVQVYELTTPLDDSTAYLGASVKSNPNLITGMYDPTKPLNTTGKIAPEDTLIRIMLNGGDTTLMSRLNDAVKKTDLTQETFIADYFKGLYITTNYDGNNGRIKYTSPVITSTSTSVTTAMWAYYHYPSGDTALYGLFAYLIFSTSPRFSVYEHEQNMSVPPDNVVMQGLHGMGIKVSLDVDSISKWKQGKSVNRAELVMDIATDESSKPSLLNMFPSALTGLYKNDGTYAAIRDVDVGRFGGSINRSTMRYAINITHLFTDAAKGKIDALYIVPAYINAEMSYAVINKKNNNPLLRITYGEQPQQ
jgi:hypothetical protein